MKTVKAVICKEYVGVACIDGTCPKANRDEYIERNIPVIDNCADCHFYLGCEDCYFNPLYHHEGCCDNKDS